MVSIIMPAYNAEKTIKQSIESVINQTFEEWELIIINDCSTDKTEKIIKSFSDNRIVYIKNEKNLKVANTRNKGLEQARFDYIAFLDSDDIWYENKLERQLNFMKKNNISFSITDYEIINNDGSSTCKYVESQTQDYKKLLRGSRIGCLTVMIDKRKLPKFRFKDIGHEDYALWLKILKKSNIKAHSLREILAKHRDTDNSLSNNKLKTIRWMWNIFRNIEKKNVLSSIYFMIRYSINYKIKVKKIKC